MKPRKPEKGFDCIGFKCKVQAEIYQRDQRTLAGRGN